MKTITIRDLLGEGVNAPVGVWAMNSSGNSELGLVGEVLLQIPKLNGSKSDPLKIDQTWLAQDLTRQIPRAQLLESSEFRHAVEKGLVTLVSEDTAKRINNREGAEAERRRLVATRQQIRKLEAARTIANSKSEIRRADGTLDEDEVNQGVKVVGDSANAENVAILAARGLENTAEGFEPSFIMFADKVSKEDDINALNLIRSRGKLSTKELRYLRDKLVDQPKTRKALSSQILARKQARQARLAA